MRIRAGSLTTPLVLGGALTVPLRGRRCLWFFINADLVVAYSVHYFQSEHGNGPRPRRYHVCRSIALSLRGAWAESGYLSR